MPPLNGEQFHLASNMKAKPNSQGTLFSANPSQRTPESRQPRGFSPERMTAVKQRLNRKPGHVEASPGMHESQAQALQTVARSTVPVSALNNLSIGSTEYRGRGGVPSGADGVYYDPKMTMNGRGQIAVLPSAAKGFVPIHEIGHHVSQGRYNTPGEMGHEEGFADAYADEHARKPGYKSRPDPAPGRLQRSWSWPNEKPRDFSNSYMEARPPLHPAQFSNGQQPLMDRGGMTWKERASITRGAYEKHKQAAGYE